MLTVDFRSDKPGAMVEQSNGEGSNTEKPDANDELARWALKRETYLFEGQQKFNSRELAYLALMRQQLLEHQTSVRKPPQSINVINFHPMAGYLQLMVDWNRACLQLWTQSWRIFGQR